MADLSPQWVTVASVGAASIMLILWRTHMTRRPDHFARLPTIMFFGLSVFALCLILSVSFFPEQLFGEDFPISTMMQNQNNNGTQWVLNIGGTKESNTLGIQIPIFIIVLGILGAYVRYLYIGIPEFKNQFKKKLISYQKQYGKYRSEVDQIERTIKELEVENLPIPNIVKEEMKKQRKSYKAAAEVVEREIESRGYAISFEVSNHLLTTVGFFLLAPLLAVMAWLILQVSGTSNQWIFALAALTVGFTANAIIERARSIVESRISGEKEGPAEEASSASLDVNQEKVNAVITATGKNFKENSVISLYYDGLELATDPMEVRADAKGSFSAKFSIPKSDAGKHEITIEDEDSNIVTLTFSVIS